MYLSRAEIWIAGDKDNWSALRKAKELKGAYKGVCDCK